MTKVTSPRAWLREGNFMDAHVLRMTERIKDLMKKNRHTNHSLAKALNVTDATVSRWLNGERSPRGIAVRNMAEVLDTTTDYIMYGVYQAPGDVGSLKNDMYISLTTMLSQLLPYLDSNEKLHIIGMVSGKEAVNDEQ